MDTARSTPVGKALSRALAENPAWARMSKGWLKTALWAYRYVEEPTPTRDDVAKALAAAQYSPTRARDGRI